MSSHRFATPGIFWWLAAALVFGSISAGCDGRQAPGKAVSLKPDSVTSLSQPAVEETGPGPGASRDRFGSSIYAQYQVSTSSTFRG